MLDLKKATDERVKEISQNLDRLHKISDNGDKQFKNMAHGLCSIYFHNDLDHFIDYQTNGCKADDCERFVEYWNNILETVQNMCEPERRFVLSQIIDKNHFIFFTYECGRNGTNFAYKPVGYSPPTG